jgi:hypothetical protein
MQGRLFEQGWGKRAKDADFFRENLLDERVNDLLRGYSTYPQIWEQNEDALTSEEWVTRYEIEDFVSDVVWNRYHLRANLGSEGMVSDCVGKYLENPKLQNPKITDYLLVDLLDDELILLERDFHVGLFQQQGLDIDTVTLFAMTRGYHPVTERKRIWFKRFIWQSAILFVAGLLISTGGMVRGGIGILILIFVGLGWIGGLKNRRLRQRIAELAFKFQMIRFEMAEQPYHAKTLIERLKTLEDRGLGVNSLIYGLLESKVIAVGSGGAIT